MTAPAPSTTPDLLPRRARRSLRTTRWLWIGGGAFGSCLLACGLGWVAVALLFGPAHTDVAAQIQIITQRIAAVRVPPLFQPVWGWEADNSLIWVQMARFDHRDGRGLMLIGEFHVRPVFNPTEQLQLRKLLEDSSPDLRLISPKDTEQRKLSVRGTETEFEIVTGEDRASTTKMRQVSGMFPGHKGTAMLILQAEEDCLSEEAITELLNSLSEIVDSEAKSLTLPTEVITPAKQ